MNTYPALTISEKADRLLCEHGFPNTMTVLMLNCLGQCDDFESVGKSAIWNKNGLLVGQLNETAEGILLYDTNAEKVIV